MRASRITVMLLLVCIEPSTAAVFSIVYFESRGEVNSSSVAFPDAVDFSLINDAYVEQDTEPVFAVAIDDATVSSPHGEATITIDAAGSARFFKHFVGQPGAGRLSASFTARLTASNPGPGPQGYVQSARAELESIKVTSQIEDTLTLYIPNDPLVKEYLVHGNFQLTGTFGTAVAGTEDVWSDGFSESWVVLQGGGGSELPTPIHQQYYGYSAVSGWDGLVDTYPPAISVPYVLHVFNGLDYDLGLSLIVGGRGSAFRGHPVLGNAPPGNVLTQVHANFGQTLTWGGITHVTNALTGETVENWTITSESGFDYTKSYIVPEPSSVVLLSFGFCAWLGWAHPRRRPW